MNPDGLGGVARLGGSEPASRGPAAIAAWRSRPGRPGFPWRPVVRGVARLLAPCAALVLLGWWVNEWAAAAVLLLWLLYRAVTRPRVLWVWSTQLARAGQRTPRRRGARR